MTDEEPRCRYCAKTRGEHTGSLTDVCPTTFFCAVEPVQPVESKPEVPSLTIRDAQARQPWTVPYSPGVIWAEKELVPHILGSHDVLHAAKTVGKLAGIFEALDHRGGRPTDSELQTIRDMAADLLSEALRLANLYNFDLSEELHRRVLEKNGVQL